MTALEFSNEFDILYNNISSNNAPGVDEYEKSVFLSKALEELIKNYFNPLGNKYREGFDDSPKRLEDFKLLITNSLWYIKEADEADRHLYHLKAKTLTLDPIFTNYTYNIGYNPFTTNYSNSVYTSKAINSSALWIADYPTFTGDTYKILYGSNSAVTITSVTGITITKGYKVISTVLVDSSYPSAYIGIEITSTNTNFPTGYYLIVPEANSGNTSNTFHYASTEILDTINSNLLTLANTNTLLVLLTNGIRLDFAEKLGGIYSNVYVVDTYDNQGNKGTSILVDNIALLVYFKGPAFIYNYLNYYNYEILVNLNESLYMNSNSIDKLYLIVPISKDEFFIKMNKPFKFPLKNLAWRLNKGGDLQDILIGSGLIAGVVDIRNLYSTQFYIQSCGAVDVTKYVSYYNSNISTKLNIDLTKLYWYGSVLLSPVVYSLRYIRKPYPIITSSLEDTNITIDGLTTPYNGVYGACELNENILREIIARAVELAKIAYMGDLNATTLSSLRTE